MPLFRKHSSSNAPATDTGHGDQAAPVQEVLQPKSTIARLLPIGDIIRGITDVLRDPNGKISSKRAGAGALVSAGIYFLTEGKLWEGGICLGFATVLFGLTKWEGGTA